MSQRRLQNAQNDWNKGRSRASRQGCVAFWHLWDLKFMYYLKNKPPCYQMAGSSLHFFSDRQQVRKKALKTWKQATWAGWLLWLTWPQFSHSMSCSEDNNDQLSISLYSRRRSCPGWKYRCGDQLFSESSPWRVSNRCRVHKVAFDLQVCMYYHLTCYLQPFFNAILFGFVRIQSRWQVLFYS